MELGKVFIIQLTSEAEEFSNVSKLDPQGPKSDDSGNGSVDIDNQGKIVNKVASPLNLENFDSMSSEHKVYTSPAKHKNAMLQIGLPEIIEVKGFSAESSHQEHCIEIADQGTRVDKVSPNSSTEKGDVVGSEQDKTSISKTRVAENEHKPIGIYVLENISENIFKVCLNDTRLSLAGAILLCILSFLAIAIIPYHNVILLPKYWYELMVTVTLGTLPSLLYMTIAHVTIVLEYQEIAGITMVIQLAILLPLPFALCHCLGHLLWSVYLGYSSPLPFSFFICGTFSMMSYLIMLWFLLPKSLRCIPTFHNRFKAYGFYLLYGWTIPLQGCILLEIFTYTSQNFHWITAILLTILKMLSGFIMNNIISNTGTGSESISTGQLAIIEIGVLFKSLYLVMISSKTHATVGYCFQGMSFLVNMKLCFDIVQAHKQSTADVNQDQARKRIEQMMVKLMLNETIEFLVPICYVVAISIAYYGPNADIIGNIQNDYWQYEKIDSLPRYLIGILFMTPVDLLSAVMSLILMWRFSGINGLVFLKKNIGRFAHLLTFVISREINAVSHLPKCFNSNA